MTTTVIDNHGYQVIRHNYYMVGDKVFEDQSAANLYIEELRFRDAMYKDNRFTTDQVDWLWENRKAFFNIFW